MSQDNVPNPNPFIASEPIINIRDPENLQNISWEVRDDPTPESLDEIIPEEKINEENTSAITEEEEQQLENALNEEENEKEEQTVPENAKKKNLRAPKDKRFADFTRKIKQRDAIIQETLAKNEYLEKQLAMREHQKLENDEKLINTYISNIETAHADALEEGDYEKATKAASLLAQYSARKESLAQQKYQMNVIKENSPHIPPQPDPVPEYNEEFHENGKEWIRHNQWADSTSPNFDHEMLNVAENYVELLMKEYKFHGRADEIGKPEFFNEITNHVKETFGISHPKNPNKERLIMKAPSNISNVSQVNRSGTVSNHSKSNQEIILTPQQVQIAHSMSGMKLNGVRVTDRKQLETLYKNHLQSQMRKG